MKRSIRKWKSCFERKRKKIPSSQLFNVWLMSGARKVLNGFNLLCNFEDVLVASLYSRQFNFESIWRFHPSYESMRGCCQYIFDWCWDCIYVQFRAVYILGRYTAVLLGLYSLRTRRLISIGIPIINLRRSDDRLMFIIGIPIPVRRRLLSE